MVGCTIDQCRASRQRLGGIDAEARLSVPQRIRSQHDSGPLRAHRHLTFPSRCERLRRPDPPTSTTRGKPSPLRRRMLVAGYLTLEGYRVSWPLEPAPYDLLVSQAKETPSRVQVKTSTRRDMAAPGVCSLTRHAYVPEKRWHVRQVYDLLEIDVFAVVDGDLAIYLIPAAIVGGRSAIHLRRYSRNRLGGLGQRCSGRASRDPARGSARSPGGGEVARRALGGSALRPRHTHRLQGLAVGEVQQHPGVVAAEKRTSTICAQASRSVRIDDLTPSSSAPPGWRPAGAEAREQQPHGDQATPRHDPQRARPRRQENATRPGASIARPHG